jgi:hypothetical protein
VNQKIRVGSVERYGNDAFGWTWLDARGESRSDTTSCRRGVIAGWDGNGKEVKTENKLLVLLIRDS